MSNRELGNLRDVLRSNVSKAAYVFAKLALGCTEGYFSRKNRS